MKLKLTLTNLSLVVLFFLSSCGAEEVIKMQSEVTLDGAEFPVTAATITGVASNGEGHASISLVNTDGQNSKTLSMSVEYAGNSSVGGTYSFPKGTDLYLDEFLTSYIVLEGSSNSSTGLKEGSVTVEDNGGNNYTVTMDLIMEDGKVFKGTYRGIFIVNFDNGQ